ncbi:MATE family efflux transporter [Chakrabartyella piscis]|uniref:MATE family efflux transporter n=1 Tax=Chakrabartyella piscis TaxID=2918914 RepID=UPI002958477F|nr:MATE family efflux transporter [Chakrabartyella piscis]
MQATNTRENKMGTMPIGKLLFTMAIPMIISMLVQALYNIVDSAFVARISENALSAVSLAYPMQNFMIATATGTGVGVNALLSKSLGAKKFELANKTANISIFLAIANWLFFVLLGVTSINAFLSSQTDVLEIIDFGNTYLFICMMGSGGIFMQVAMERLLQGTGRTVYAMISQGIGAIINIVLDPILIFGLFGMPALGVAGAAYATIIGQICGACLALYFNAKKNTDIELNPRNMLPTADILKTIYRVAIPSILMISVGSIMMFFMNGILNSFTPTAIAVFGGYFKIQSFIFMPVFGLNNAMVPIIAFNYGARNKARIVQVSKLSILVAMGIMLLGFAAFQLIPHLLLAMFNASENMLAIGVPAFKTISFSFLAAGFCVVASAIFQAMGNGLYSLITSVTRQLVVLLPVAYILSLSGNLQLVWLSFPIAEVASVAACVFFLKKIYKKLDF